MSTELLSADGRYVVFLSPADNLLGENHDEDQNGVADFFVKDIVTLELTCVSTDSYGNPANGPSYDWPSISADGHYVVFASYASNLLGEGGDTNGDCDVFVKDMVTHATTRVSTNSAGGEVHGFSQLDAISDDGRYVVFTSDATDVVAGDTNGYSDVFLKDRVTGVTTRVSTAADGTQGDSYVGAVAISPEGRYVAFEACSNNLLGEGNDTNNHWDIFVKDLKTGLLVRANTDGSVATDHTSTTYDRLGRTLTTTDQRGVVHTYSYDAAGSPFRRHRHRPRPDPRRRRLDPPHRHDLRRPRPRRNRLQLRRPRGNHDCQPGRV